MPLFLFVGGLTLLIVGMVAQHHRRKQRAETWLAAHDYVVAKWEQRWPTYDMGDYVERAYWVTTREDYVRYRKDGFNNGMPRAASPLEAVEAAMMQDWPSPRARFERLEWAEAETPPVTLEQEQN